MVSGLPAHYESASLEQLFCGFGQISGIRDICNGTAFVTFEEKKGMFPVHMCLCVYACLCGCRSVMYINIYALQYTKYI